MAGKKAKKREERKKKYTTTKQRMENRGDFVSTTVKVPEGMEVFKFQLGENDKKKKYLLDIIPYAAGKNNPVADEGEMHWERTYYVHKDVGPKSRWYVCATNTFGDDHPCPICEHAAKLRRSGKADKEALKEFKPSKRQLFYVKNRLEKDGKVRLLDIHGYMKDDTAFGQLIDGMLENKMDEPDHKYHNFFHLEDGMTIEVMSKKHVLPGGSFVANGSTLTFEDRKKQYKGDEFDDLPSLDDLIIEPDYDKMKKAFLEGGVDDEEEEDDEDGKTKASKKKKEDDDGDEDEDTEDEDSDEDGEDSDDEDDDESEDEDEDSDDEEEEEDEEDEEDEKPVKKKKGKDKGKKKKKKDDDEDDDEGEDDSPLEGEDDEDDDSESDDGDDEDEDEEEDEKPKKKGKGKKVEKKKKKAKDEDEDEEDDDEDSDDDDDDDEDDAPWDDDDQEEEEEEDEEDDDD